MKVLCVTQYGILAASSLTRVFQYVPYLAQQGIQCQIITVLPDKGIGGSQIEVTKNQWRKLVYYIWAGWRTLFCGVQAWWEARRADVLFVQKVIFPAPVRWLLRWRRPPVLYDFDDAIFTSEVRQRNWLASWKQRRNAAGLPAMLRLADHALVENEYTTAFAARFCPRVSIITGPIDTQRYCAAPPPAKCPDEIVLGWIGSATTLPYLHLIQPPLARLSQRFPNLRLRVIGAKAVDLQGIPAEAKAWSLDEEVGDLQSFDIGLMPMPDDPWTRGKGGYKLLQYMAMALPVVASPVGVNQQIVQDGENGFWARTHQEWEERLEQLIGDPLLRRTMGQRGRAAMEARYALDVSSQKLVSVLRELAQKRKG